MMIHCTGPILWDEKVRPFIQAAATIPYSWWGHTTLNFTEWVWLGLLRRLGYAKVGPITLKLLLTSPFHNPGISSGSHSHL